MRILLVEDNERLAKPFKKLLEAESYAVDWRPTAEEAYDVMSFEHYDVIILDLALPGMDGITLARTIRKEKVNTPILMLTARGSTENRINGLDSGGDDYMVKPFDFNEVLARIRALIRRASNTTDLSYTIDSLMLDPASHIVTRAGRQLELSAKEYAFLEFLMRHPGQIMTKQQIIESVWDSDLDPFSNNIDVYLGYLRKKIDKQFPRERPLIKTIKGLGYKVGG
jgi:DNA-binding response OmpR family regulator